MSLKRYHLLFSLLLTCILLCNIGQAQNNTVDSITLVEPPFADSTYDADEEYEEEYGSQESYEDSVQRNKANAFDTLNEDARLVSRRKLQAGYIDNLKKNPDFDYVKNGLPQPKARTTRQPGFFMSDIWIYLAVIGFLLLLAWYLKENDLLFFRKKSTALPSASSEEILKDIFSIQYAEAIKEALQNKNYRLAVRLRYLQLLKALSEKGIIQYQPDKTNFDYLLQVRATPYYSDFSGLTRQYEYSWYGLFPISQAQYDQVDQLFTHFHKKINA